MGRKNKQIRRNLIADSLNSPNKKLSTRKSLEIINSVLEGRDLKSAFGLNLEINSAHPHSYPWPFDYKPKIKNTIKYEDVSLIFGYFKEEPSNLDFIHYKEETIDESDFSRVSGVPRWRILHELAHKEVKVPDDLNPKSLIIWEWEVLKKQREIEKSLGFFISDEVLAKDSNSFMQDVVYRSLTGIIPKSHEKGFSPYENYTPIEFALSLIEDF